MKKLLFISAICGILMFSCTGRQCVSTEGDTILVDSVDTILVDTIA